MPALLPPLFATAPTRAGAANPSTFFGSPRGDLVATGILSAVAGYVDAAGFLALFGLFTAHITGDLVAAGTAFTGQGNSGVCLRLATIPVFMVSVAATALVTRATRRRGHRPLIAILTMMTLALAVFCATGVTLRSRLAGLDDWAVVLTGTVGIFAMGIQNTLMRDVLSGMGPTTIMTGNLTRLTMDLVALALPEDEIGHESAASDRSGSRGRLVKSATPVLAFVLGTALGGAATAMFGLSSIAAPAATVGALTVSTWLRSRTRVAVTRRAFELGLDRESVMLGCAPLMSATVAGVGAPGTPE
jgi:uncharacterized membrane protein YoaK (UPF0700 family)